MDENLTSATTDEVVENMQEVAETEVVESEQVEQETEQKVEVTEQPTAKRDYEKDAAFAKMRRAKEEAERKAIEREKEAQRLKESMKLFFNSDDTNDLADQAKAQYTGKSVEEIRAERLRQEEAEKLKQQIQFYQTKEVEHMMENDLKTIQAIDPSIKSLDELGTTFLKLIGTGEFTATEAYYAIKAKEEKETKIPPKEIGKVNQNSSNEKEFFTSDELDKLTDKDLSNPKILEKAKRSMLRLK